MSATYTTAKTYFRGDPRFGRTTTLLADGQPVLEVMGVIGKRALITQHQRDAVRTAMAMWNMLGWMQGTYR